MINHIPQRHLCGVIALHDLISSAILMSNYLQWFCVDAITYSNPLLVSLLCSWMRPRMKSKEVNQHIPNTFNWRVLCNVLIASKIDSWNITCYFQDSSVIIIHFEDRMTSFKIADDISWYRVGMLTHKDLEIHRCALSAAKTPGHQYPQHRPIVHCIRLVSL